MCSHSQNKTVIFCVYSGLKQNKIMVCCVLAKGQNNNNLLQTMCNQGKNNKKLLLIQNLTFDETCLELAPLLPAMCGHTDDLSKQI